MKTSFLQHFIALCAASFTQAGESPKPPTDASLRKYRSIKAGTPDPYTPPKETIWHCR